MLARLEMILGGDEVNYRNSSNLQGVIMENIDSQYAELMHQLELNPYSQCLIKKDNITMWCVSTLSEEAYEHIIVPLLDKNFTGFSIKKGLVNIKIKEKRLITHQKTELMREFYDKQGERFYNVEFATPTSFKSNGRYEIFPNLEMIYRSLMKKYSATSGEVDMYDEDTLEELINSSEIVRYRLNSTSFPLERVTIPSYKGSITIRVRGNDTISRYIRLLLTFGEYSGVGVKASIGMGAIRFVND